VEQAKEKIKTHITSKVVEKILSNETEVKEKTNIVKEIFEKLKEKLKKP
jgi:hypothetical protein